MRFFDAHSHLQMPQFDADRLEVLERMKTAELGSIVIGVDYITSKQALALAESNDFLWAAVGLHPHDNPNEVFNREEYEALARHPKVVAVGECGLDYSRSTTDEEKGKQRVRFEAHIELALTIEKPLIIHCRDAHDDMLDILRDYMGNNPALKVVIHFCTVSGELAEKYLALGCYLSFPGPITYTDMYDRSIEVAPLERILAETDSPFAASVPFRGKRNEPSYVEHVVAKIALVKNEPLDEMAAQIVENAREVFGIAG
jgi:TatD DNase family protein